jgi:hypothetical protein
MREGASLKTTAALAATYLGRYSTLYIFVGAIVLLGLAAVCESVRSPDPVRVHAKAESMMTLADYFASRYRAGIDLAAIRLHYAGADRIRRAFGGRASTVGTDIYFRDGAFAPHTRDGLRLLAPETPP